MKDPEFRHIPDVAARRKARMVLAVVAGCVLPVLAGVVLGYSRSSTGGAIRSATVPPSSYQSGLIEKPSPVDNSGNLLITGNVAGGKYFHGSVPYRSTTSIDAPLGSTTLDSFMRYTEPTDFGSASQGYTTFYSPTGTVAALPPGGSQTRPDAFGIGPIGPMGPIPNASGVRAPEPQGSGETGADAGLLGFSAGARLRSGTLPVTSEEGRDTASDGPPQALTSAQYQQQLQELQQRLGQVQAGAVELERRLADAHDAKAEDHAPQQLPADGNVSRRQELLQETARLLSATMELPPEMVQRNDAPAPDTVAGSTAGTYEGAGLRLYDPRRDSQVTLDAAMSDGRAGSQPTRDAPDTRVTGSPAPSEWERRERAVASEPLPAGAGILQGTTSTDRVAALMERLRTTSGSAAGSDPVDQSGTGTKSTPSSPASALKPTDQDADKRPAFSPSACESHLQAGQTYLKQGKHLRAAESFALASAYNPNEARAYLGRCQALLGAGEFLGSALSLAKAIELDPKRALQRADLIWISGGPDAFLVRFKDLVQKAQVGDAPQLQFLSAYVYYQMERPEEARAAIDAARKGLPSSLGVEILSSAIHQ